MKNIKSIIKRYRFFIIMIIINIILGIYSPKLGLKSMKINESNILEMLKVIPPVFILLGLLDVWVEKEVMIKYMGKNSGLKGLILAFVMGSSAAGPLYIAFPIAGVLLKKRASFFNVFIFIGAWSTTKVPMFLFEVTNLGGRYALLRLGCSMISIIIISFVLNKILNKEEKKKLLKKIDEKI